METSNKNTADCPIEDLFYLIQQDEVELLRSALLDIIDRFQPEGEIYLYEQGYSLYETNNKKFSPKLLDSRGLRKKEDNESNIIGIPSEGDEDELNSDSFKFSPTDDYIQVFSVESERSNRGLLITINKDMIDEEYINTLLRAYNNQVYLLRNKDTDSLTGLYNRQSFDYKLTKLHKDLSYANRSNDEESNCYFALLDIDFFKSVNDEFGHVYGDEVLLMFSNLMKNTFRDIDLLFRYGGEEFAILLKDVTAEQTQIILNRFRQGVEAIPFPLNNTITVSIGYCAFIDSVTLTTIIERADKALYYSKEHGRNTINSFELLLEKNEVKDITIDESDIEIF